MKIRVLKLTDREVELEVENEGHTFLGALQSIFLEDPRVEFVGYNIPHPLIPKATFTLKVAPGNEATTVLKDGVKNLNSRLKELEDRFLEAYGNVEK
ncbi:DNA-directed RNA polymerase subunit L [Candidatus Bathyarchaeota archaeon]|nr:DNA-directed RNA polymerase subunit L [Candidatus Bathyarchaeota archaeon]MBS7613569.1 DNA-directed RNA polymerase subunit L [Candidatus Bathyarchaeota archaeon]MBS7618614.1 DNA-directed RNA polymerase subunit L [Candidatus Bathyarchaeota archaeon]